MDDAAFSWDIDRGAKNYNYRISRARRVIENTIGIMRARWCIFSTTIKVSVENTERYVRATISPHNYLRQTENLSYCLFDLIDSESSNGAIKLSNSVLNGEVCLQNWRPVHGFRPNLSPIDIRKALFT